MRKSLRLMLVIFSIMVLTLSVTSVFADYPLLTTITYSADPSFLEYNGVLYSYWSNDDNNNGSYSMHQITCLSTTDLKHWTNNGQVIDVPRDCSWAYNSWAPAVVYRNGYFWMYFGNGGGGIGVAKSTSPTGPFKDAKGSALITTSMPNCNVTYCFDPGVLVDDDGRAYCFFGGGGPGNARVIELGSNMISTVGTAVTINAPYFFEDSWIHKYNGKYYYSYSSDFSRGAATIEYMMSSSPMTGYVAKGTVMPNPPDNSGNNNHHSIFQFRGNWYMGYHNRYVAIQQRIDTTYKRNACLDQLFYNADGTMKLVACTKNGLTPVTTPTSGPTPTQGPTPTPTPTPIPGTISIAAGSSSGVGSFQADQYYSGGSTYNNTNTVDVSQITSNPPPATLFNNERYGAMSYTIPGFTAGNSYTVTLYFAETYLTASGRRLFNVSINGSTVLSSFDIYASAGGQNKAIARSFTATANSSGQIVIQFTSGTENPKINGISIKPGVSNPTPTPTRVVNTPTPTPTGVVNTPTPTPTRTVSISIAAGNSSAVGSFQADQYYSGGSTYRNSNTVDVSQITSNPPPAALFNNERYGAMSYTIPGFTAGSSYTVTLYFAETYLTASGRRLFNVSLNGSTVLSNFDIYASAGGQNKAIARSFTTTANSNGQIVIQFISGTENPKINGISIK